MTAHRPFSFFFFLAPESLPPWDGARAVFFYSGSINQHGLNTPLTMKSRRFWPQPKAFLPTDFPLFSSSADFLSSSAPFRIFQCFTVGTKCLPCRLPAPVISTTCFYHASAVELGNATNTRASIASNRGVCNQRLCALKPGRGGGAGLSRGL